MDKRDYNRQYYLANRKKALAQAAAYRESHREEIREYMRSYYKSPEGLARIKADRKANRARNTSYMRDLNKRRSKEKVEAAREYQRQYNQEHRDRMNAAKAVWKKNNKDKVRKSVRVSRDKRKLLDPFGVRVEWVAIAHKKRAEKRLLSDGTVTLEAIKDLFSKFKNCPYCGIDLIVSNRHLDHKEPLSRGGLHSLSNLIPCCSACNHRKSAKPYSQWLAEIGQIA